MFLWTKEMAVGRIRELLCQCERLVAAIEQHADMKLRNHLSASATAADSVGMAELLLNE